MSARRWIEAPALVGLRRAFRSLPLALILWGVQLALAAMVAVPMGFMLAGVVGDRPAAAALFERLSIEFVVDLMRHLDGLFSMLLPLALGAVALALIGNALCAGGVLEVLLTADARPLGHRFGRGVGRFAGRMLRIGALAAAAAGLLAVLGALPFAVSAKRLVTGGHEVAAFWLRIGGISLVLLVVLLVLLALDLARVRLVRDDRRDTLRLLASSVRLVLRHPLRVFGAWLTLALLLLALLGLSTLVAIALPAAATFAIVVLLLMQQVTAIGRALLRVALWSAEIEIVERVLPPPAEFAADPD